MKVKQKTFLTILIFSLICSPIFSKENSEQTEKKRESNFSLIHNYGFAWNQITRIQLQSNRSNFVWRNDLIGAFYSIQTKKLPINFIGKISAFYPYHYEFNKFPQISKQIIVYAFDLEAGPIWTFPIKNIMSINFSPVCHYRYQLSDEFSFNELGVGILTGFEFPISPKFTVLLNGDFVYSPFKLGKKVKMRPYDHIWHYGIQLGFRYSKRNLNQFTYFKKK